MLSESFIFLTTVLATAVAGTAHRQSKNSR